MQSPDPVAVENPFSDLPLWERPKVDFTLATEWERMPMTFGRWRDVLTLASDPETVILLVEYRLRYVRWSVSPPGPEWAERALVGSTIQINVATTDPGHVAARDITVEEAKTKALAAYAAWCAEQES